MSLLVFEIQVNGQRGIWKRLGQWRQLSRDLDRTPRRQIEIGIAAPFFKRFIGDPAVALNREFHDQASARGGALIPAAPDALEHDAQVVGTAEVGDVEGRTGSGTAACGQSKA